MFFRGKEGIEEDGLEAHSGQYHALISNGPKEGLELPDYPFKKNDPELTGYPSFPDQKYMLKYLGEYADKYGLRKNIRFQTWVEHVSYDEVSKKFTVQYKNLTDASKSVVEEKFDYVIVATGHFNFPNFVTYPGQETFPGLVIHSKYFMDARRYKGKRVLVVGSSYSAEDIAVQSFREGAKHVTLSYRTKAPNFKFPEGMDERPLLTKIEGSHVRLDD